MQVLVNSAVGGTAVPYTVGQAFRQGDVPSGTTVVSDAGTLQAQVKNRWPDGSVKFAILSGRVDLSANSWRTIGLRAATAPAAQTPVSLADLKGTGVSASVQFGAFGTAAWNAGDWDTPEQSWVSGPEMSSWTYRKPIGGDAHLVAWLEVRAYRGGKVEVLPWIENGYLNVSGPGSKSGAAVFTLSGSQRFSQTLTLLHHQRAVLASGATLTHWVGGDPQVTPRHDTAYLMSSKLVPNYRGVTASGSALFARLAGSYTPLERANFQVDMPSPGYDPAIGLLPEWDVSYLTSGGDPRSLKAVLINGYAAGRYGTHYRDEKTNRPLLFTSYPTLVLNGTNAGMSNTGASQTNSYTPTNSGAGAPVYDAAHHPSMGYMAYLLSGWSYYMEETQLLAATNYLRQNTSTRLNAKGVFESSAGTDITRGAAWSLRTLAQAAAITPDADTALRGQLMTSIDENINYYHGRYVAQANNPLGLVKPYDHYTSSDPWMGAVWMDDFFTGSFGYLKDLQVSSSAVQSKLDTFLAWKYRSVVGRLGGSGAGEYSYRYAAQYTVPYAPSNSSNFTSGAGPWYGSWGEVARAMGLGTSGNNGEALETGYPTEPTAYWGNLMPALSYAVDHGAAGADLAYARLTSASNWPTQAAGYNNSPVWGVKPRSR